MSKQQTPQALFDRVAEALGQHGNCRLAIVFGSLAGNSARFDGDIDLAVLYPAPLTAQQKLDLIDALAGAAGRPVDLIDLATVGEPLLGQILSKGKRLLGSNTEFAKLLNKHLLDQADFLPYRNRILAERRVAWIGRRSDKTRVAEVVRHPTGNKMSAQPGHPAVRRRYPKTSSP